MCLLGLVTDLKKENYLEELLDDRKYFIAYTLVLSNDFADGIE